MNFEFQWSRFDEVFELLLETMELETQIDLRDSYIRNLVLILNTSDLRIIRWSKRLFRIFTEYVKTVQMNNSDLTINYCLKVALLNYNELNLIYF